MRFTLRPVAVRLSGYNRAMTKSLFGVLLFVGLVSAADIKVGIIGLDTSHAPAFTRILNDKSDPDHIPGAKVVAAFPGGSPDIASSRDRLGEYTARLRDEFGVEIVDDIRTLCSKVDAVLLESIDGRKHLEQVRAVFEAGLPVFIDKPLAASLEDAREIVRLGKKHGVPWWSASNVRYHAAADKVRLPMPHGVITWGPAPFEPTHHLDLSWYGIHPVELLFSLMGTGCQSVTRTYTEGAGVIVGTWKGGRLGTVRAIRDGKRGYGAIVYGDKEIKVADSVGAAYPQLMREVVKFFGTRVPPVSNEETLEIFAFMDAALRSKENGGAPTKLR